MILCYVAAVCEETWFVPDRALTWFALAFRGTPPDRALGVHAHWRSFAPHKWAAVGSAAVPTYHEVFTLALWRFARRAAASRNSSICFFRNHTRDPTKMAPGRSPRRAQLIIVWVERSKITAR